jgi:hypothetical protein
MSPNQQTTEARMTAPHMLAEARAPVTLRSIVARNSLGGKSNMMFGVRKIASSAS